MYKATFCSLSTVFLICFFNFDFRSSQNFHIFSCCEINVNYYYFFDFFFLFFFVTSHTRTCTRTTRKIAIFRARVSSAVFSCGLRAF